jgi:four helix bundle protein
MLRSRRGNRKWLWQAGLKCLKCLLRAKAEIGRIIKNKIDICETEAREAQYWLAMILEVGWLAREDLNWEYEECSELLAIFTSIGKSK